MRTLFSENRPWLSPDEGGGSGGAEPVVTLDTGNTAPVAEVAATTEPAANAPSAPDFAALTEQMLVAQREQAAVIAALRNEIAGVKQAAIRPEDDMRTEEQKLLAEIAERQKSFEERMTEKENIEEERVVLTQTDSLLAQLIGQNPFTKNNAVLAETVKNQIKAIVQPQVKARPRDHGLTAGMIHKWFNETVNNYKKIHESWPGQAAAVAAAQATINARAADTGGGASPGLTDAKARPDADSEEYWEIKKSQAAAVWNRNAQV